MSRKRDWLLKGCLAVLLKRPVRLCIMDQTFFFFFKRKTKTKKKQKIFNFFANNFIIFKKAKHSKTKKK